MAPELALLGSDDLKTWAQQLLRRLAQSYAVEVQAFALEADEFHLVLRWTPDSTAGWNDDEAARRWRQAHPPQMWGAAKAMAKAGMGLPAQAVKVPAANDIRRQLGSLSMFMKQFKQMLAQKINRENRRRGSIWRGRFHLAPLADASAVAGAMAFVDLRRVVETGGERPEEQPFTSVHTRVGRHQAMLGMNGDNLPSKGEAAVFGPEVAQPLREATGFETTPMPTNPGMPPVEMPGMGAMPMMPPPPMSADSMGMTEPSDPAGPPPAYNAPWLLALREDGPRAVLAWLPLPRYLKLLDALVEKAKAWPHLPATAPGRAPPPKTPPWEGALAETLSAMGLNAQTFQAQWARLAKIRM